MVHASQGELQGEDAFYRMAMWSGGTFQEDVSADVARYPRNVEVKATHLFMEAARQRDEEARRRVEEAAQVGLAQGASAVADLAEGERAETVGDQMNWPDAARAKVERLLAELDGVGGLLGAAAVSHDGAVLASRASSAIEFGGLAAKANAGFLALRELSAGIGLGRADLAFIRAPRGTFFLRCLNENLLADSGSSGQKLHFHLVVLISPESNAGMAKILVDKLVVRIAEAVRSKQ